MHDEGYAEGHAYGRSRDFCDAREALTTYKQSLVKMMPKLADHICRFNDGEQECDCYKSALDDVLAIIQNNNEVCVSKTSKQ